MTLTRRDRLDMARELGVSPDDIPEDHKPRYNIAPTQAHLIVTLEREDRIAQLARWGLINSWAKDKKNAYRTINARAETVEKSPAFRSAFKKRRCLVPVDGFYEWQGPKGDRQPYWFHRSDGGIFYFAGLYELWKPADGDPELTFTVVTTEANEYMGRIHNRMPVILDDDAQEQWLYPGDPGVEKLKAVLKPAAEDAVVARPVSQEVNNARNEGRSDLLNEIILDEPAY